MGSLLLRLCSVSILSLASQSMPEVSRRTGSGYTRQGTYSVRPHGPLDFFGLVALRASVNEVKRLPREQEVHPGHGVPSLSCFLSPACPPALDAVIMRLVEGGQGQALARVRNTQGRYVRHSTSQPVLAVESVEPSAQSREVRAHRMGPGGWSM